MKKKSCYLFLFEGYADWEPALAIAGLRTYGEFEIRTFSVKGTPVKSMGGLTVKPDFKMNKVSSTDFDLMILPGGDAWENGGNMEISKLVTDSYQSEKTIAGICAATTFLARIGLYVLAKHTSNGLEYLKIKVAGYAGEDNYINEPSVSDKNLITANGAAMIEFAYNIFKHFKIMPEKDLLIWLNLYKSGGMKY